MEFIIGFLISLAILIAVIATPVILSRISKQINLTSKRIEIISQRIIEQMDLVSLAIGVLDELIICPECGATLKLNNAERTTRRFECPHCKKVTEVNKAVPK